MLTSPLKNYKWSFERDGQIIGGGYNDLLQDITLPKAEITVTTHGAAGDAPDIETPNKVKLSDMVVKKLFRNDLPDNDGWNAIAAARTGIPSAYLFNVTINVYGALNKTVQRFFLYNCWIKKVEYGNLMASNADADNHIETLTMFVQDMKVESKTA